MHISILSTHSVTFLAAIRHVLSELSEDMSCVFEHS